jgi:hypothetical protein
MYLSHASPPAVCKKEYMVVLLMLDMAVLPNGGMGHCAVFQVQTESRECTLYIHATLHLYFSTIFCVSRCCPPVETYVQGCNSVPCMLHIAKQLRGSGSSTGYITCTGQVRVQVREDAC